MKKDDQKEKDKNKSINEAIMERLNKYNKENGGTKKRTEKSD
jgi:hypothetical protein